MSSIYVSRNSFEYKKLVNDLSFAEGSWHEFIETENLHLLVSRYDRKDLWAPAIDPVTQTRAILVGRIALSTKEWGSAKNLPYEGGLACRYILDAYLKGDDSFPLALNGAFGVFLFKADSAILRIITDRFGFFPLYLCTHSGQPDVCNHPDVLARHADCAGDLDLTTMAESLAHGYGVHPHTYYSRIKQMDPGSVFHWDRSGKLTQRHYWRPSIQLGSSASINELATDLASALKTATKKRTQDLLGTTGLFLSAGADSRAILYAASEPAAIQNFTFYDTPNEELHIAKCIAESVGSSHRQLQRHPEEYALHANESVRVTGGMWNILDAHYTGFLPELSSYQLDNYLSGCFADYFFKGLPLDKTYKTLFGRNLPVFESADFSTRWYAGHAAISPSWSSRVQERNASMYEGCDVLDTSEAGRWKIELARVYPISREANIASRTFLLRTLPWDPLLSDNDLISIYLKIPPGYKLNGRVWEKAVELLTPNRKKIPNNNTHSRIGASETEKVAVFLMGVLYRKIMRKDFGGTALHGLATRGSWPNFNYFLKHSSVLPHLWEKKSFSGEIIAELLGYDPWGYSLQEWADRNTELFYRILTLKLWLDQR